MLIFICACASPPSICRYGGLYADLDLHPVDSVDGLLRGQTLLLPHTPNIGLTNAMMAATTGHPFITYAMSQLPEYAHAWHHTSKHNTVLTSTGSTFIWAMHMRWARDHTPEESARLVPAADWGKCSYCTLAAAERPRILRRPVAAETPAGAVAGSAPAVSAEGILGGESWAASDGSKAAAGSVGSEAAAAHAVGSPMQQQHQALARRLSRELRSRGRWLSPFAHGEGNSWHSGDSLFVLMFFCHLDMLLVLACALCVYLRYRSIRRTALIAGAMFAVTLAQQHYGILYFEMLLGRPWIWLIMT